MRSYGQYCPIALAAEVFAERWTPIIIRNLHLGCAGYNEILDGAPGLPRSVLSQRLRALEHAGVVSRLVPTGYRLTESGRELADVVIALGAWGSRWRSARAADQDPYLALWTVARLVRPETLSQARIVVEFHIVDRRAPDRYWLVLSHTGNEVCATSPGFQVEGFVSTDTETLVRWYAGEITLEVARRDGGMAVTGPRWLSTELAGWGRLNPYMQEPAHG
jgi:DNA-binding HxlR family transcriptional regulator